MTKGSAKFGPAGRPPWWALIAGLVAAVGLVLVVVGFIVGRSGSGGDEPTPASVSASPSVPSVTGPFAAGRSPLPGFGETAMRVRAADGSEKVFCVLAADTVAQQRRGLMEVTDKTLGGYDGMIFRFSTEVSGGFWMRNTPMPLSIAYLNQSGSVVTQLDMKPCRDSPTCPPYPAAGPYRAALEVPNGGLARLGVGTGAKVSSGGQCRPAP